MVGILSLVDALREQALRVEKGRAGSHVHGSITQLRNLHGLAPTQTSKETPTTAALPKDALTVSIDTEHEIRRLKKQVVEIGITTLDTLDTTSVASSRDGLAHGHHEC